MSSAHAMAMSPRAMAYREQLIAGGMAAEIADITIARLLDKGAMLKAREAELRAELALLESAIAAHREETRGILQPLEAEVAEMADATTRACAALEAARVAREAELNATLGRRRDEINREIQSPYREEPRSSWISLKAGEAPHGT